MRFYITISADAADKLIAMAEREKRSVNAQASWLLERLLKGIIAVRENEGSVEEAVYAER
jgi:hypothetical protein